MPRLVAFALAIVSLYLVGSTEAQQITALPTQTKTMSFANGMGTASGFDGADPRKINFTPVDTSAAMRKFNMTQMTRSTQGSQSAFNVAHLFPKISLPSWPPKPATTSILPQSQNKFQPNLPKGQTIFPPAAPQK